MGTIIPSSPIVLIPIKTGLNSSFLRNFALRIKQPPTNHPLTAETFMASLTVGVRPEGKPVIRIQTKADDKHQQNRAAYTPRQCERHLRSLRQVAVQSSFHQ